VPKHLPSQNALVGTLWRAGTHPFPLLAGLAKTERGKEFILQIGIWVLDIRNPSVTGDKSCYERMGATSVALEWGGQTNLKYTISFRMELEL